MLAHVEALVGGVDHEGVVQQALLLQVVEHTAHVIVERLHHLGIVAHVALVLPFGQLASLRVLLVELLDDGCVEGIVLGTLFGRQTANEGFISSLERRLEVLAVHLRVVHDVHILPDAHLLRSGGRTAFVVVIEVVGHGESLVLVEGEILQLGQPVAVDGLVVDEEAERFVLVAPVLHPVDTLVGDEVGQIAFLRDGIVLHGDEARVVVVALAGQDFPIVEAGGQAFEVPLADDGRLVARLLEQLGHGLLGAVEHAGGVVREAVGVAVLARNHAGTAGAAQRVGHEAVGEAHTVGGDAVEVGRLDVAAVVAAHHLRRVVVGHDVDDVVGLGLGLLLRGAGREEGQHGCRARKRVQQRGGEVEILHINKVLSVVNFQVGNLALERAGLLEREDKRTDIVHGVLATIEVAFLDVHRLNELAVNIERGGTVVTLHLYVQLLARIGTKTEGVQIAVARKTETAADGIGQVEDSVVRTEELGAGSLVGSLEVEADGIAVAYLLMGQAGTRTYFGHFVNQAFGAADTAQLVDAGSFAQTLTQTVEVGVWQACLCAPRLGGQRLQGGEEAVMDVLDGDTVAHMVVPHGKHTTQNGGVFLLEDSLAHVGGRPLLIEILGIQVVVVVTGGRHDVNQAVGDADELVALTHHLLGVGIAVVPGTHDDVLRLDGRLAGSMGQRTPYAGLLAVALHQTDVTVGKGTELLDYIFLLVGVFVGADVDTRTSEYGLVAFQIFLEEAVHELVSLGIEQVEMIHAILFTAYFGLIMAEGQRMGGRVDFGDNLDET